MSYMLAETKNVLEYHPHSFIYFCQPLTRASKDGPVRDRAIGVYNWLLDIHIFGLNGSTTKVHATLGPLYRGWHTFGDVELRELFEARLLDVRSMFSVLMDMEVNNPGA